MTASRRCIVCGREGPFRELFRTGPYRLVRCPGCRLVFQDPQPGEEVLARSYYYDEGFTRMLLGPLRDLTLERARMHLRLLRAQGVSAGGRAFDVGCSSGAWLEVAADAGFEAVGVEVGASTAAAARERGLEVHTGTLADAAPSLEPGGFSLVTFWDVLEHLPDPRRELRLAARLLAPGGVLAAAMPNVEGWYPRATLRLIARRTGVWEYPELPVHLYDFSPATITRLLAASGFEQPRAHTFPTPFAFYRTTSLSPERLGRGPRGRALRAAFELLRLAVYPAARAADRSNSLFAIARRA